MRKKVKIMRKRRQIMRKFVKLMKLFPWLFPTYKIHINVLPRIPVLNFMFDLLLPFMDRYFFVQRSFPQTVRSLRCRVCPKLSNQALNQMRKTRHRRSQNQNPVPSLEDAWNAWRFNIVYERKGAFSSLFWLNNFFKMINLFAIFPSKDGKQLSSRLYVAIFKFNVEKCAKDEEVGQLCGSAPPHPVRCPDYPFGVFFLCKALFK